MDYRQIKYQLSLTNISLADIADECGVSITTVSRVIRRMNKSAKIERAIAEHLGMKVRELFTDHNPRVAQVQG